MRLSIQNPVFTKYLYRNPGGSIVLGYLRGEVTFHCESGATCALELRGALRVKLNQQGELSLSAPSKEWEGRDGTPSAGKSGRTPAYRFDDATYAALLQVVGNLPEVQATISEAKTAPAVGAVNLAGLVNSPNAVAALISLLQGAQNSAPAPGTADAQVDSDEANAHIGPAPAVNQVGIDVK